ncbi:multidrug efflux system [Desulfosarcina cetonica]|uniref:efflux RND transporter periplasmic adaptor subunit n=1 Tax=Desulfosarcina cetonica TaxID=90730 RepID=UPI0006D0024F|nr:efflux RND transporter periplasmic adaptor subunit [Desulfosarcina cetonica]VTR65504.1 multidrug efflux system [Desulfosarcina cetonica]
MQPFHLTLRTPLIVLLAGLLLTGCQNKPSSQGAASPPPPQVTVVTVNAKTVLLRTPLPGRTSAFRVAEIRPQVNGLIEKRMFTEGADVKAGDLLYKIDAAPFEAALRNAEAALGRSAANLPAVRARAGRYQELLAEKAVSQQDYDDASAALKQAEADMAYWTAMVQTARINLAYTRITAPISGRIGPSNVTEGAIVTAYQPVALATIQQLDPIYVDVPQSTTTLLRLERSVAAGRLQSGGENLNTVGLTLEDGTPYAHEGDLQFRGVSVDASTGSVMLRIIVPNPDNFLLPGMFVRAEIKEGVRPDAILVPQQAVARDPKGRPVASIVDGENKVQQRMLTLDRAIGDQWLVNAGLGVGDRLIVEGLQKIRPGMTVAVAAPQPAGPGTGKIGPAATSSN